MDVVPSAFTVDYTGQPGDRTFFLQAREEATRSFLIEKQQVEILGERLREMLMMVDSSDAIVGATPARDPEQSLEAPIEPEWRIGSIAIGYVEDSDQIVVSLAPVEEEPPEDPEQIEFEVRYFLSRDQVRSFVVHALAVVGEGRPLCQLCGLPMDPDGHNCPASNGHRVEV